MADGDVKYNGDKVTLREFDQWREDHLRSHDQWMTDHMEAHRLERAATEAARQVIEARLLMLNELRADVVKDRAQFIRCEIYDKDIAHLSAALLSAAKDQSGTDGKLTALLVGAPLALALTFGALTAVIFLTGP